MREKLKTGLFVALAALFFLFSLGLRNHAKSRFQAVETEDDRFYLPPAEWLRFFSLGYNEAVTDLIWIKTILYFGSHVETKEGERFVMSYLETAADLDQRFKALYVAGSVLTLYQNHGKVTRKSIDMSMRASTCPCGCWSAGERLSPTTAR
jgi:hypothetical protein